MAGSILPVHQAASAYASKSSGVRSTRAAASYASKASRHACRSAASRAVVSGTASCDISIIVTAVVRRRQCAGSARPLRRPGSARLQAENPALAVFDHPPAVFENRPGHAPAIGAAAVPALDEDDDVAVRAVEDAGQAAAVDDARVVSRQPDRAPSPAGRVAERLLVEGIEAPPSQRIERRVEHGV